MLKPYLETAFKGKQDKKFKQIAGPELRKGHLAKAQCKLNLFPQSETIGICWDNSQELHYKGGFTGGTDALRKQWKVDDSQLTLPLPSQTANIKESIIFAWIFIQYGSFFLVPFYLMIGIVLDRVTITEETLTVFFSWIGILVISKLLFIFLGSLSLIPKPPHVVFNRTNGMIELQNDSRTGHISLPFEQFNAHHRTSNNANGRVLYGFTLLHYQEDYMYQKASFLNVNSALSHWELIKNFMDTSKPLADIPQFERFREQDPVTSEHDKKNNRPKNFWYRVDKQFMKEVSYLANQTIGKFPADSKVNTLETAKKKGYGVPDIILYPWKHYKNIAPEQNKMKQGLFKRIFINPLMLMPV